MSSLRLVRVPAFRRLAAVLAALCVLLAGSSAHAATNYTWTGPSGASWATSTDWSPNGTPAISDTATFNASGSGGAIITASSNSIAINTLLFASTPAAYSIGSAPGVGGMTLADSGAVIVNSTVANPETINANLTLGVATSASVYTFSNSSASLLSFAGAIQGGSTGGATGVKTLTISGSGNTTLSGNISSGGATGIAITDVSGGTLGLTGASNVLYTLNVNGGSKSVVNQGGGTIVFGADTGSTTITSTGGGVITGGILTLNGGVAGNWGDVGATAGGTLTINSTIAGNGIDFFNSGLGTTVVTGANAFTGAADIFNQVVVVSSIGNAGALGNLGTSGTINLGSSTNNPTLKYVGAGETNNRIINLFGSTGNVTIDQSGSGLLDFTSALISTNTGAKTLTLQGSTSGTGELAGTIGDSGNGGTSLSKLGTGLWILAGANTYTGATNVSNGTLTLSGNRTANAGTITVSNSAGLSAVLNITAGNFSLGGNSFFVGNAPTTAATGTVNQTGGAISFSSGNGLLVGNNVGIANVGNYNLSGGTLSTTGSSFGVRLGVNNNTSGNFNLSGAGVLNVGGTLSVGRAESGANSTTDVYSQSGGTATVGSLTMGGFAAGSNNVSATMSFTGGVFTAGNFPSLSAGTANASTIIFGGTSYVTLPAFPSSLGTSSSATVFFNGGTLNAVGNTSSYLGGVTGAFVQSGGANLSVTGTNNITITQNLLSFSGSDGGLSLSGGGILTLTGSNTYTGGTNINGAALLFNTSTALPATGTIAIGPAGALAATSILGNFSNPVGGWLASGYIAANPTGAIALTNGTFDTESIALSATSSVLSLGAVGSAVFGGTLTPSGTTYYLGGGGGTLTYTPNVTGSYGLVVGAGGGGTLLLTGANTYSGPTILAAGVLSLNSPSSLPVGGSIGFAGGTLQFTSGNTIDYSGVIASSTAPISIDTNGQPVTFNSPLAASNTGGLTLNDSNASPGSLTLAATELYTGPTTITAGTLIVSGSLASSAVNVSGTLQLANASALASSVLNVKNGATLQLRSDLPATFATNGNFTLAGSSTTTFNVGPVTSASNNSLGMANGLSTSAYNTTSTINVTGNNGYSLFIPTINATNTGGPAGNGYNLDFNPTTANLTLGSINAVTVNGGVSFDVHITLDGTSTGNQVVGNINAATGGGWTYLYKQGSGEWTLSGANSFQAPVTITGGTLALGANNTLPTTGSVVFGTPQGAGTGVLDLTTFNQTLASLNSISNSSMPNVVNITPGQTLTLTGTGLTVGIDLSSGSIATTSNLTMSGGGSLMVTGGSVMVSIPQVNQNGSNTAKLDVTNLSSVTLGSASSPLASVAVGFGQTAGGTLLLSNTANTITANVLYVGASNGGNATNPYLLQLGARRNVLAVNTIDIGLSKATATLDFSSTAAGSPGSVVITSSAGGAANINIGNRNGTNGTSSSPTGTLDLRGHMATVTAGSVSIGSDTTNNNTGSYTGNLDFDTGTFTATTVNIANLGATSTTGITGNLNIGGGAFTAGTLSVATKSNTGTGTASGMVNVSGGTLSVTGGFTLTTQSGSASTANTNATLNITGGLVNSGVSILKGNGTHTTATITVNGGTLNLNGNAIGGAIAIDNLNFLGGGLENVTQINNGAAITKTGAATLTLAGSNSFTGATNINGGVLSLASSAALAGGGSLSFGGGTLQFSGGNTQDYSSRIVSSNSPISIDTNGQFVTFSSPLAASNNGGLTKGGNGVLDIAAAAAYIGPTTINAGTIALDAGPGNSGSLPATNVSVNGGASLMVKGNASVAPGGSVVVAGGDSQPTQGTIDLRDGTVNTFTLNGNLTLGNGAVGSQGSVLDFDLGGGNADTITVNGSAAVSGSNTINLNSAGAIVAGSYNLITASGGNLSASNFGLGALPYGFYGFSLSTPTVSALVLTVTGNTTPSIAYWTGAASLSLGDTADTWGAGSSSTASNWSTTPDGTSDPLQLPAAGTDVLFTASNATGVAGVLNTTLEAPYSIHSLTFGVSAGTISSVSVNTNGNALTLGAGGLSMSATSNSNAAINGAGSVVLNGSQSWANQSNSQSLNVSVPISALSGPTTLTFNGSGMGAINISGPIGDGGGQLALVVNQSGAVTLSGTNSYSGTTTIVAGELQLFGSNVLSPASSIVSSGDGTLDLGGVVQSTSSAVSFQGGVVQDGMLTQTGASAFDAQSGNVTAALAGNVGLNKTTAGTVVLAGANTYSGNTSVSAGVLQFNAAVTSGGTAGSVIVSGGTLALDVNNALPATTAPASLAKPAHLDLAGTTSQTFSTLNASASNASVIQNIGAGQNLNIISGGTGAVVSVNSLTASNAASLTLSGPGGLVVTATNGSFVLNCARLQTTSPR